MQFDRISAVVRPRNSWEAADLGILLARAWWRPITKIWLAITLPAFLFLNAIFYRQPLIALAIFWWLKPIWERPILYILSQALFGEPPSFKQTLRIFPAKAWRQIFGSLLWRRFSTTRSMDLPVIQLENLQGKGRAKRLKILHNTMNNSAFWLTFICLHIESVLVLGIGFLAILFVPEGMSIDWKGFMDIDNRAFLILQNIVIYVVISLVSPFYVACGFSLYINRRTLLEAWDIEIGFRRLRNRLQNLKTATIAAILFLGVLLLGISPIETVLADESVLQVNQETSSQSIKKILQGEEFHQVKPFRVLKWFDDLKKKEEENATKPFPEWFIDTIRWIARSIEFILWLVVIVLILIFVHKYRHWILQYLPSRADETPTPSELPKTLFGMSVGKENLPMNIVGQVDKLWRHNEYRAALSLLYRAALTNLMETHGVPFRQSHTESECVRLASTKVTPELSQYFTDITDHWCSMAYAHVLPTDEHIHGLCRHWDQYFARKDP